MPRTFDTNRKRNRPKESPRVDDDSDSENLFVTIDVPFRDSVHKYAYCTQCLTEERAREAVRQKVSQPGCRPAGIFELHSVAAKHQHQAKHKNDAEKAQRDVETRATSVFAEDMRQNLQALVELFCREEISFVAVKSPLWQRVMPQIKTLKLTSPKKLRAEIIKLSEEIRRNLLHAIGHEATMLMIDAGTVASRHYLNVSISFKGVGYFWKSIPCETAMTGDWIRSQVDSVLKELMGKKINVLAICADNAANMQSALELLTTDEEEVSSNLSDSQVSEPFSDEESVQEEQDDDNEADGEHEHPQAVDVIPVDSVEEVTQQYLFLKPIRCWAHLLQLCFKDIKENEVIATALAVALRVYDEWGTKDSKAAFKAVRDKTGWLKRGFTRPAETRWNSYIRLIVEVFEFEQLLTAVAKEKNIDAWNIQPAEVTNLRIAVLVLQPLQWATDTIQKESCTVDESAKVFATLMSRLQQLRCAITGKAIRNPTAPLERCAKALIESLTDRRQWFENDLIKIYRQLNQMEEIDGVWMQAQLCAYWKQVAPATFDERKVESAFHPANIGRVKEDYMVKSMLGDITTLVFTEAVVERTFQKQKAIIGHTRYAMKDDVMNAVLFIKHNIEKVRALGGGHPANFSKKVDCDKDKEKNAEKENSKELISESRYAELLAQVKDGAPSRPAWLSRSQIRKVEELDVGHRIEVKFLDGRVAVWHTAIIKSVTKRLSDKGEVERIWTVEYGNTPSEKDVTDFNPLNEDWEWRLLRPTTQ